jgi:sugar lactone lactonase YvrE
MRILREPLIVALASLFAAACGGKSSATTDGSTGHCTPGESAACAGSGGCSGNQTCNASGTYDSCVCPEGDAPSGLPSAPYGVEAAPVAVTSFVSEFVGNPSFASGSANGTGSAASFDSPFGLAIDSGGNLYVADDGNNLVRSVTPAGVVGTFAGTGSAGSANGSSSVASFDDPVDVAVDAAGNVYVADRSNQLIREVTAAGVVSTLASVAGTSIISGIAVDATGNVYVADTTNNLIRKVTPAGVVSTFAGTGAAGSANGSASTASFFEPNAVRFDAAGNLYVADYGNSLIRVVTPAGMVTTLAEGVTPIGGIALDAVGNVYVNDSVDLVVRRVTPAGVVTTLAGGNEVGTPVMYGAGSDTHFFGPAGIATSAAGDVYVSDGNGIVTITTTGIGQLLAAWSPPTEAGASAVTSYTASASAPGYTTKTCTADAYSCTISGLTSGTAYTVSVTATNGTGASEPSLSATAIPN